MMLISILGYAVFTGLTALSTSFVMLVSLRFLTGLFMGSEWGTGTALLAEVSVAASTSRKNGSRRSACPKTRAAGLNHVVGHHTRLVEHRHLDARICRCRCEGGRSKRSPLQQFDRSYNIGAILGYLTAGFLADWNGRRWYLAFLMAGDSS